MNTIGSFLFLQIALVFNHQRPKWLHALLSGLGRGWKHWLSKLVFNWKLAGLRALHYSSPRQESSASYIPPAAASASGAEMERAEERGKADRYIGQRKKSNSVHKERIPKHKQPYPGIHTFLQLTNYWLPVSLKGAAARMSLVLITVVRQPNFVFPSVYLACFQCNWCLC